MRLCFGSYLAILVPCKAVNIDNKQLCEALLHSVAPNYEFTFSGQENADRVREDATSKLLRCEQNLSKDITGPARNAVPQEVASYFKNNVINLLDSNLSKQIILALKDMIGNDFPEKDGKKIHGIYDDTKVELVNGITKKELASQTEFCFHSFLAGVFLYVVTNTTNRSGKKTIRSVTQEYVLSFTSRIEEITLLEDNVSDRICTYDYRNGKTDTEFAEGVAEYVIDKIKQLPQPSKQDDSLLVTLLSEANGKCLYCGGYLGIPKRGKIPVKNCEIVYLKQLPDEADSYENAVALYQYYNTDLFNAIYDGDKSRKSLSANDVPAATQLFTPDWAVGYMVENSLGRFWSEGHPETNLTKNWKYFLKGIEQSEEVKQNLKSITKAHGAIKPEDIRCIDPCAGSGHIIAYLFDVLMQIYTECGYTNREAVKSIIEKNLWGLDIDERAAQLASFSVSMKAIQYDRRFLRRESIPQPNVYVISESNHMKYESLDCLGELKKVAEQLLVDFHDANEYGSILKLAVSTKEIGALVDKIKEVSEKLAYGTITDLLIRDELINGLLPLTQVANALVQRYEIVVTNPPYLGSPRMNSKLSTYIKKYYEEGKADFCTVMYLAIQQNFVKDNGFVSLITTNSWMYLKSFVKMREITLRDFSFTSIVDYGTELFEGKIGHLPIIAWVARKSRVHERFPAIRLVDYKYGRRDEKYIEYFNERNLYYSIQDEFADIDGQPVDYWLSEQVFKTFKEKKLESFVEIVSGMTTGDNDKYLREWNEVDISNIAFNCHDVSEVDLSKTKWIPYHKGGEQRKWYGNHEYVVNWSESKNFNRAKTTMTHVYLKPCITWSDISGNSFAGRFCSGGFMFDVKGSCAFGELIDLKVLIGLFNSKVTPIYVEALNPTSTTQVGDLKRIPFIRPDEAVQKRICALVDECVSLSKADWDDFEFSWDFAHHPLITSVSTIEEAYENWSNECDIRIERMKAAEEELNGIYLSLYGLQEKISPVVKNEDITIRRADVQRDIRSLISYSVGCMFGRYSLDREGIVFAGGIWNDLDYTTYTADNDNILPISDDEYFEDDIVSMFTRFIAVVYGKSTLEENLNFIAKVLGGKGSSREIIRNYFLNDFYNDHLKIYQKRPIYWLFDSGKKNGFKALVYVHRYQPDTMARMRTDYVHEQQSRYRTAIADIEQRLTSAQASERVKLSRQLKKLREQSGEIQDFEEKIHHLADQYISFDLNDGVVKNYDLFRDVLAKRK